MSGIGGTPPSTALEQFLRDSYDVVQAVHRELPAIRAIASHLTPVEDLVEFQNEVTALHAKLGVLVYASELMAAATDAGIDLLVAADAPAQRALLNLKSAALQEASHFATAAAFDALTTSVVSLSDSLDQALTVLATKVSQDELTAALSPLITRLEDVESGDITLVGELNDRLTQLISQLTDGSFGGATAAALDALTTRVAGTETGLVAEAQKVTALQAEVVDLTNDVAGNSSALTGLTSRVESSEAGITAVAEDVVALTTNVTNLQTGQTATATAVQSLQSRTSTNEDTISAHTLALTQLGASIDDAANEASLATSAIQGLETRMESSEVGQLALASDYSQLSSRVTDTETGLVGQADATSALATRVDATEQGLTVAAEDRTELRSSLTSTGNHLPNPGFVVNTRGWTLFSRGDGWLDAQLERNLAPTAPGALPDGMFALSLTQDEIPAGNAGIRCANVPVEDLQTYLLSGYLAAENCTVRLEWRLLDGLGTEIGFGLIGQVTDKAPSARLSEWTRVHGEIPVATDGAQVQAQLWVTNCHVGFPEVWLLRPQLEPKSGAQVGPSPWMDGVAGIEETFSTAVQSLETRVTSTEEGLDTLAQAVTNLGSQVGVVREWRVTQHSGSTTWDSVGSPASPGLRKAGQSAPEYAFQRGLTLVRFDMDGELLSATRFDTFSSSLERNNLRDALLALGEHDAFLLVSQGNHGVKQVDLTAAMESCGAIGFANVIGSRPYLLIGRGLAGKGGGVEYVPAGNVPWQDTHLTVVNDTPKGLNSGLGEVIAGQANALDALTTRVTSTESGMTALASDVTALDARVDTTETDVAATGTAVSDLTVRMTATEDGVTGLSSDVTQLETTVASAVLDIQAQGSAVTALTTEVANIDGELTALSSAQTGLTARMANTEGALINEIITSANKSASFSTSINALSNRVTDAEGAVQAVASGVSSLDTRVTTAEGSISSHSSYLTNLQNQVNALDADTGGSGAAISALDVRVTGTEQDIDSLTQAVTSLESSVTSANKIYAQASAPPTNGTDNDLWFDTDDNNKPYTLLNGQWVLRKFTGYSKVFIQGSAPVAENLNDLWINTNDGNKPYRWNGSQWLDVSDVRTAANSTAITNLTTRTTTAEGNISTQSSQISTLQSAVNHPSTGLTANANAVSNLTTKVTSVEGSITSQSGQITNLQNTVNHPSTGVSATSSAVSSLTTRVGNAEGTLSSHATSISSLNTTVGNNSATVTQLTSSVNGLKAEWNVSLDVNGYISGIRSQNNGSIASFHVLADVFKVLSPSGSSGLTWENGILWNKGSAHSVILGQNFGSSNNLMLWAGPTPSSAAAATKSNGVFWIDNTGAAYFGGTLSIGIFKNAVSTSVISGTASVEIGNFGTNGDAKVVTASFGYSNSFFATGTMGGDSSLSAVLILERSLSGGSWVEMTRKTLTGQHTVGGYEPGDGYPHDYRIGGSFTFTDNNTHMGNFNYRVRMESAIGWPVTRPSGGFRPSGVQNLSVTSIEE